ncbi:TBPIP domain-containing protein [Mycena kentingensis (nom. inval.)]|nr:TBPIP domain-containing protein [Mycena kentingensis (nom. inval.)]
MPPKAEAKKGDGKDVKVLKGDDAERAVLDYVQKMNRPYGATDVAANLKGPSPTPPKPLPNSTCASQAPSPKPKYRKSSHRSRTKAPSFQRPMANRCFTSPTRPTSPSSPPTSSQRCKKDVKALVEENKVLGAGVKAAAAELAKIKATPTDDELDTQIANVQELIEKKDAQLNPLRSGAVLISAEDIEAADTEWIKWRAQWVRRRKVFKEFWGMVTDSMSRDESTELAETLGIEQDSEDHVKLEQSDLCQPQGLKRKR